METRGMTPPSDSRSFGAPGCCGLSSGSNFSSGVVITVDKFRRGDKHFILFRHLNRGQGRRGKHPRRLGKWRRFSGSDTSSIIFLGSGVFRRQRATLNDGKDWRTLQERVRSPRGGVGGWRGQRPWG